MKKFASSDEILDFAISEEEAAAKFYRSLAQKMEHAWMQQVFEDFAEEEEGHKAKLLSVKEGKLLISAEAKVMDLKIGDYLIEVGPNSEELDYQHALIVAMKKEKAAFKLYSDLAAVTDNGALRQLLLSLAQEEAKHKLRFELEYDEHFLAQN